MTEIFLGIEISKFSTQAWNLRFKPLVWALNCEKDALQRIAVCSHPDPHPPVAATCHPNVNTSVFRIFD